ncbi:MAG: carbohydrate-binding family 9-like protein [Pyrinomonadaceae bacterium]
MTIAKSLRVTYAPIEINPADLSSINWSAADRVTVDQYWSGEKAPARRSFEGRLLWTATHLLARFDANQDEELVVSSNPDTSRKVMNLWDRDVVEIFVAPDRNQPRKYFEFEAAPTGEWLDVAIDSTCGSRVSDWEYKSGMVTAAKIEDGRVVMAMKLPWTAFGKKPEPGDVWLGNILRCVGKDPDRGYLAWSSTMTDEPNFHVPERFGEFHFIK